MAADPNLADHIDAAARYERLYDPPRFFEYVNARLRLLIEKVLAAEIYVHAANLSGKTTIGAFLAVEFLKGSARLGDVPLPVFGQPCEGIVIIRRNKDGGLSTVKKIREAIGLWPHHEATTAGALDYVGIFYVKPRGSTDSDYKNWSRLYIYPHGSGIPAGIRIDFAWADEPPPEDMWREVRFRWRGGGKPFVKYITATPKERTKTDGSGWGWLMEQDEFLDCLGEIKNGRLRIQTAMADNSIITPKERAEAESFAANDPHGRARMFGEHCDDAGENPFKMQWAEILRLEQFVCDPQRKRVRVAAENIGETVERLTLAECELEVFEEWDPEELYIVVGDPSLGVPGGNHDPCGTHVYACRFPRLVLRYNGFCGSYGLGTLSAYLGEGYGDAWVWPLVTGGHGGPMLTALGAYKSGKHPAGYPRVGRDRNIMRPGTMEGALGITENAINKSEAIEAGRKTLAGRRCGIPSRKVLDRLKTAVMDDRGLLIQTFHGQYEDVDCFTYAMHILEDHPPLDPAKKPVSTAAEKFLRFVGGRRRHNLGVLPKARWR